MEFQDNQPFQFSAGELSEYIETSQPVVENTTAPQIPVDSSSKSPIESGREHLGSEIGPKSKKVNSDGNSYHNCTFVINSPDVHGQNSILQGIPHGIPGWPNNMSPWQNPNPFVQLRTPGYYNNVQNMSQQHQNNHFMGIPRQHPNRQSTSTMYTYQHSLTQEPNYNRQSQTPTTNHINPYNMNQTRQHQEPDS